MNNIYICHTEYHVLIAILKSIKNNEKSNEIVLCGTLQEIDNLYNKILKSGIFKKIYIFKYIDFDEFMKIPKGKNFIDIKVKTKKFIKENYNLFYINKNKEIYIFNDHSIIGRYLRLNKIYYNILEDGLDCYKNIENHHKFDNNLKQKIKIFLNTLDCVFGKSKYVKNIEVNSLNSINLFIKNKFIEFPRKKLFESLTKDEKKQILNVFVEEKINNFENASILITQPLYKDGFLNSKIQQIEMYKYILNKYAIGKVIIKPHPRDEIEYSNIIDNCIILDKKVPIEVLNFINNITIERAITAFSTAIDGIDFCKEKIKLGYEWVNKYRNGEENER